MVRVCSFPYEADPSSTHLLSENTQPFGSVTVGYDDVCSLLGSLSISTDQLRGGTAQAGLGASVAGRQLDHPQMDLDSAIISPPRPNNAAIKIEPPSINPPGTKSSIEWYQQLLATTRNEIQAVLKRMRDLETSGEVIQYPDLLGQIQNSQERAALSERLALLTHHQDALTEALYFEETMLYYGD